MNLKISTLVLFTLISTQLFAQDENDALRFGQTFNFGTSRAMSVGGATGALGADFSSVLTNPAGIGLYRASEISFSPAMTFSESKAQFSNTEITDQSKFNFNSLGLIISNAEKNKRSQGRRKNWRATNVVIGFNRLANYNSEHSYSGTDNQSSVIESFEEEFNQLGGFNSNSIALVSDAAYAAYTGYLIDENTEDPTVAKSYVPYQDGLMRTKSVIQSGSNIEYAIGAGASYKDKFYLGGTLGLPRIEYDRTQTITEQDISGKLNNDFNYFTLEERLATQGNGVNFKLGAIWRVTKNLRLGASVHTPTAYSLTDISSTSIETHTDSLLINSGISNSPIVNWSTDEPLLSQYTFVSPMKALLSATLLLGQKGFLSGDLEYVDYAGMRYNYGNGFQAESEIINAVIKGTYKSTMNLRLGGEFKMSPLFALRAGFSLNGNPLKEVGRSTAATTYNAGLGYRKNKFFADFVGQYATATFNDVTHQLNRSVLIPNAGLTRNDINLGLTVGWRF